MSKPIAYGVDLGTTNSAISVAYSDRIQPVPLDGEPRGSVLLRSLVYLHRNGMRASGNDALRQYAVTGPHRTRCSDCDLVEWRDRIPYTRCRQCRAGGFCQDARIIAELKAELASTEFSRTHSWGVDFELPDLVAVILQTLKRTGDRFTRYDVGRAVIGYPVLFQGAEGPSALIRQHTAIERLKEAARRAGLQEVELLEEPAAVAVLEEIEGLVLITDFGAGTFDVALVYLSSDEGEVVALQGAAVGGERFNSALFDAKVAPAIGMDEDSPVSPWLRQHFRSLAGAVQLLTIPGVPSLLHDARQHPRGRAARIAEEILYGGHAHAFYTAIENAKIALSTRTAASIDFHRHGIDLSIPVSRVEFEKLIAADLAVVRDTIRAALEQAGVRPADVDAVIRTGGSSAIPAFGRLLEDLFGQVKVHQRPLFTSVVDGLAAFARTRWTP